MSGKYGWSPLPGALYDKWPKDAAGEPVPPRFLTCCRSTDLEDTMLVNMLDAYGVPAVILPPNGGDLGKVILGMSGFGNCIFVPETMYDAAKELMEAEPDDDLQSGI